MQAKSVQVACALLVALLYLMCGWQRNLAGLSTVSLNRWWSRTAEEMRKKDAKQGKTLAEYCFEKCGIFRAKLQRYKSMAVRMATELFEKLNDDEEGP